MDIGCHDIKLSRTSYEYDGKAKYQSVEVEDLKKGVDYTVEYSNNIKAGTGLVTIRGTGANTGSVTKNFLIKAKKVKSVKISAPSRRIAAGRTVTITAKAMDGSNKKASVRIKLK